MLKFYYNGIKASGGKLQKCFYSLAALKSYPEGTITIYARDYQRFCPTIRGVFTVENDTDLMTDYFDEDKIRVKPDHPFYSDVLKALQQRQAKRKAV